MTVNLSILRIFGGFMSIWEGVRGRFFASNGRRRRSRKNNKLTTRFGRFVEGVGYYAIALSAFFVVISASLYFYFSAGSLNGLKGGSGKADFWEALYFSVITFTSLGYGDIVPQGYGRVVAALEVLFGLALTALFIGKISSERQSALLLLVYTSDQQRRLTDFSGKIEDLIQATKAAPAERLDSGYQSWFLWKSLSPYLKFHSNQGRITEFGNRASLRQLYRAINDLLLAMLTRMKDGNINFGSEENFRLAGLVYGDLAADMIVFYKPISLEYGLLTRVIKTSRDIKMEVTQHLIGVYLPRVEAAFDGRPKSVRNYHEIIAKDLGVSPVLVSACIKHLHKNKRSAKASMDM